MALNRTNNTNYSEEVLMAIDRMPIRELFVKLEVLTWKEEPIKEIQGVLTGGNISINGKSSVRRTCTLNFLTVDNTVEDYIQLDTKFKLYIGLKNHLPIKYKELGDTLWFKQGTFVFTKASFSHNATSVTVNVTAQDKMCLLNGTCGGTIPDFVVFHEIEMTVQDRINELSQKQRLEVRVILSSNNTVLKDGFSTADEAVEWGNNWRDFNKPDLIYESYEITVTNDITGEENNVNKFKVVLKETGEILKDEFDKLEEATSWGEQYRTNNRPSILYDTYKSITWEEQEELNLLQSEAYAPDDIVYIPVLIYTLIQECVNHYGGEKMQNIRIDGVPLEAKHLMEYRGNRPIYLLLNEPNQSPYYSNFTFDRARAEQWVYGYEERNAGDLIGYQITAFTWPGELAMTPGSTVTAVLDKIKNILGNYEYFYDIDGVFHFQEIKNYLNTSYQPLNMLDQHSYEADFNTEDIIYSFKNNPSLITAYSNSPKYEDIKNDFVVWGERKNANGSTTKIRYHLAIDSKPAPLNGDWRERIYIDAKNASDEEGLNFYKKELDAEWRNLYNPQKSEWYDENTQTYWNPNVENNPGVLNYFLDFIDDTGPYGKWSVNKIGRRTIAKEDKDCVAVLNKRIPDYIFTYNTDEQKRLLTEGYENAIYVDTSFKDYISVSPNRKTCLDAIREMLYINLSLNENINLTTLPIYWLEPNRLIEVEDNASRIYGKYEINSISIPLTYNGTMTIQGSRVLNRL